MPGCVVCASLNRVSPTSCSSALHALDADVQRIDRVARRHEQAIALDPAEADGGATLGECDEAHRLGGGGEDLYARLLGGAHAPAAPQIAAHIDTETLRASPWPGVHE